MNLFSWINELFVGKRDWDSFSDADKKKFSPFMVNRYLSMGEDFLPFVNLNSTSGKAFLILFTFCELLSKVHDRSYAT